MLKNEVSAYSMYSAIQGYSEHYLNTFLKLTNDGNVIVLNIENEMLYINDWNIWKSFISTISRPLGLKKYTLQAYLKDKGIEKLYKEKTKPEQKAFGKRVE